MFTWLSDNLLSVLSILISIIFGYYFYRKSQIKPVLAYQLENIKVIDIVDTDNIDDIEIKYVGRIVERLNKTYLVFWNDGNKTIDGSDIIDKDKLRVAFNSEGEILSCRVIKCTRKVNGFRILLDNTKECIIKFDFLDPSDGAVVEILHTFKSSPIEIKGVIKGIPKGIINYGLLLSSLRTNRLNINNSRGNNVINKFINNPYKTLFLAIFVLIITIIVPKCIMDNINITEPNFQTINSICSSFSSITALIGGGLLGIAYGGLKISRNKFPKELILKDGYE